jgi:uncharacterized protein with GYD domain
MFGQTERGNAMTLYIALTKWTDQGVRNVTDSPRRLDQSKALLEQMGGRFHSFYMTMGKYDMVILYEAPDDAVAARFTLLLGKQGFVRTQTLKAFPEQAYRQLISSIS